MNESYDSDSICKSDEQMAKDMQLALDLQAREEKKAERRRKKQEEKKHQVEHNTLLDGFAAEKMNADHMLFVKCRMDGRHDVDLLVDTGASVSAMSSDMVAILGLESKFNPSVYGDAKGVGSSAIVGVVENVECKLGHVEFRLFFMVLDGGNSMPYAILGLDQMRRFKCQVDLDENVLIFGGKDGVNVPFLSQTEAMMAAYKMIGNENITPTAAATTAATTAAVLGSPTSVAVSGNTNQGVSRKLKSLFKK